MVPLNSQTGGGGRLHLDLGRVRPAGHRLDGPWVRIVPCRTAHLSSIEPKHDPLSLCCAGLGTTLLHCGRVD